MPAFSTPPVALSATFQRPMGLVANGTEVSYGQLEHYVEGATVERAVAEMAMADAILRVDGWSMVSIPERVMARVLPHERCAFTPCWDCR